MSTAPVTLHSVARSYASADDKRAWWELGISLGLYVTALVLALSTIGTWWLMAIFMVLAAAMGLRIYMIQHDCLHRAFFTSRRMNDVVGTLLSPIAMTPYQATRYKHNLHHRYVADLNRRDAFEIDVMTLAEWNKASRGQRLYYRIYRSPFILVAIGPFILYAILRRMPLYGFKTGVWDLVLHNLLLAGLGYSIWAYAGWPGIWVWIGSIYIACTFGGLIPYVLHNFEHVHWGRKPELNFEQAALEGSSVLDWGWLFNLVTMDIAYHDLHHLNAKIPGYKIRKAHEDLEARGLIQSEKISFIEGVKCLRWKLYDEDLGRMIPFPSTAREVSVSGVS
ncbi:fatty acid desaturase [Aliiroseovarius sp. PrR006]|uniref:fatty acid desaturase n=1 Tax=Aliiroseovarius sp. PrR006 TaxID=2706883 RepID=UPI0013CFAD0A|nr:fatty acid desaturase [Aliiroseovarius sp. PrR006]NDW53670.1 fatty acid desaturase [Aliiroseovarius sp. PrR006]